MKKIWLKLAIVVSFLIVASPVFAEPKVQGRTVDYNVQGVMMKSYLAYDENIQEKRPGVLVFPEWWGLTDYPRMRARMLAELGYVALAVDLYGEGKAATQPQDAGKMSSELAKNFDLINARFMAALDFLKGQPSVDPSRIAAIGYCFGGTVVLNLAAQGGDLKGVASFHGSLGAVKPGQPGAVKAKILVLHGGDDKFVTPEQIEAFKQGMNAAGADLKFVSYPGALHSFTNPEATELGKKFNMAVAYNAEADKGSWDELKVFLKTSFKE